MNRRHAAPSNRRHQAVPSHAGSSLVALLLTAMLALLAMLAVAPSASAHPLGNFTTNTAAAVTVGTDRVDVTYVLDLAEIPALQAKQGFSGGFAAGAAAFRTSECASLAMGLEIRVGEQVLALRKAGSAIAFPPGQGGLTTLRLDCRLTAPATVAAGSRVRVEDANFADRIGWREISLAGDGVRLAGTALPSASTTDLLRNYPKGAVSAPLRVTTGSATATPGGPRLTSIAATNSHPLLPRRSDRLTRAFTSLVSHRHLSAVFALIAVLLAIVLGAFHALAPGHGKTLMAAYIVGRRGGRKEVLAIGSTVALAHTAGVLALGVLITSTKAIAPERAMKWLSVISGVLLVVVGGAILVRRARGRGMTARALRFVREDTVTTTHSHGGFTHSHILPAPGSELRTGSLIAMGLAGGLVPSPSALVVLLGAITLGRVAFGLGLVAAYGVGMATTLMMAGILLVRAEARLRRWTDGSARLSTMVRWLPVATAALLMLGGLSLVARSVGSA